MTQAVLNEKGFATTAGLLTVYAYLPETGEYAGETTPYISIDRGIPANCTLTAPPEAETGFIYCWDGKAWNKTENHRGEVVYNEKDGSPFEIKDLGPLPENYTEIAPPQITQPGETINWNGSAWQLVPPSDLFTAKQQLSSYLHQAAENVGYDMPPAEKAVAWAKQTKEWIESQPATSNQTLLAVATENSAAQTSDAPPTPPFPIDQLGDPNSGWWV